MDYSRYADIVSRLDFGNSGLMGKTAQDDSSDMPDVSPVERRLRRKRALRLLGALSGGAVGAVIGAGSGSQYGDGFKQRHALGSLIGAGIGAGVGYGGGLAAGKALDYLGLDPFVKTVRIQK